MAKSKPSLKQFLKSLEDEYDGLHLTARLIGITPKGKDVEIILINKRFCKDEITGGGSCDAVYKKKVGCWSVSLDFDTDKQKFFRSKSKAIKYAFMN